ncbi:MAG: hypothetical protein H6850_01405 [Alphaproteobacteria bacterium]|nr:MAG: hypothetical protein H6850_01405 [Alphaproteobacteria bacterium]
MFFYFVNTSSDDKIPETQLLLNSSISTPRKLALTNISEGMKVILAKLESKYVFSFLSADGMDERNKNDVALHHIVKCLSYLESNRFTLEISTKLFFDVSINVLNCLKKIYPLPQNYTESHLFFYACMLYDVQLNRDNQLIWDLIEILRPLYEYKKSTWLGYLESLTDSEYPESPKRVEKDKKA